MSRFLGYIVLIIFFYMVGPSSSSTITVAWSLGNDYTTLATGNTFSVGDTIVFNYAAGHTVDEVSENDYKSCTIGNALTSDSSGATTITLTTTGPHYFICGIPGHCTAGMKLSVNVASGGGGGGGANSTTPTTSTPTTSTQGGAGYGPMTIQPIPCTAWALSSPVLATWTVVFICFYSVLDFEYITMK